jgi:hypothetical protein
MFHDLRRISQEKLNKSTDNFTATYKKTFWELKIGLKLGVMNTVCHISAIVDKQNFIYKFLFIYLLFGNFHSSPSQPPLRALFWWY